MGFISLVSSCSLCPNYPKNVSKKGLIIASKNALKQYCQRAMSNRHIRRHISRKNVGSSVKQQCAYRFAIFSCKSNLYHDQTLLSVWIWPTLNFLNLFPICWNYMLTKPIREVLEKKSKFCTTVDRRPVYFIHRVMSLCEPLITMYVIWWSSC